MRHELRRERIWRAVYSLVAGNGDLAERVKYAYGSGLMHLSSRDFPSDLVGLFDGVVAHFSRARDRHEGDLIDDTIGHMEPSELHDCAEAILRLYTKIVERDEPLP